MKWLSYVAGFLGLFLINNASLTMLLYRYDPGSPNLSNLPLLVPSALVGVTMFFSRSGAALLQPIIGYISDRCRSRWGCRRPFLAAAVLPLVACFILLFTPPLSHTNTWNLVYLLVILCIFHLGIAVYQVPYLAWLPALAHTPEQRVKLSSLMAVASMLGSAIGGIGAPWLTQRWGFSGMAIAIGSMGFVTLLTPLTIKEDFMPLQSEPIPFWKSLQSAWQNSSFRSYMAGLVLAWIAVSILSVCPTFLAVALLNQEISFGAVVNGIVLVGTISGLSIMNPLTKRWGNKKTLQFSMIWFGCGLLAIGIWPFWIGTALSPWLILLLLIGLSLSSFFTLPNAMLPEIIHQDAKQFGVRREAVYFGTRGLLVEMSLGAGFLVAGMLLVLGKTPTQPWGVQLAFPVAGLFALAAAWAFAFYQDQDRKES